MSSYVCRLYLDLLYRTPETAEVAYWSSAIENNGRAPAVAALETSEEFFSSVSIDTYGRLLSRPADPGGYTYFYGRWLEELGLEGFIAEITTSDEFLTRWTTPENRSTRWTAVVYEIVLGRSATPQEIDYWAGQLATGVPRLQVANAIAASPEHAAITTAWLYRLLGRAPDPEGWAYWLSVVATSGSRYALSYFAASDEAFTSLVDGQNEFPFGQPP